ncbi:MAG: response regulator [Myxococcota bacterium]|nr:response regulator [Myxococcota bacterium]
MADGIKILLVEDNPADIDLTRENLDASKILHELHVVTDGLDALAFLNRESPHDSAPRPDLVLLDLNLPRKDGRELLADMKGDESLRRIPVVVLTSSQAEEDVVRTYDLQASAFVTKPVDLEGFGKIVRGIEEFWFSVVRYPSAS